MSPQLPSKAPGGGGAALEPPKRVLTSLCPISLHDPFLEGQSGGLLPRSQKGRERSPLPVLVPAASKPADQEVSIQQPSHTTAQSSRNPFYHLYLVHSAYSGFSGGRRKEKGSRSSADHPLWGAHSSGPSHCHYAPPQFPPRSCKPCLLQALRLSGRTSDRTCQSLSNLACAGCREG